MAILILSCSIIRLNYEIGYFLYHIAVSSPLELRQHRKPRALYRHLDGNNN